MNALQLRSDAIRKIESCWCSYCDRQIFKVLKHALSTADHSLTWEVMRQINPAEAELLRDPAFKTIIRFRFAGAEFPPFIVFKVFIKTDGRGIKYLSGKKIIRPATKAAVDSCHLMGNRKFLDQIISDLSEENQFKISDELDVTNLKDCMKYLSTLDEMSARTGGKDNTWRRLSLEVLPRQHVIYDVLTYLQMGKKTEKFIQCLFNRRFLPATQEQQVELIRLLMKNKFGYKSEQPSRRSRQTRARVERMKKVYQPPGEDSNNNIEAASTIDTENANLHVIKPHDYNISPNNLLHDEQERFVAFNDIDFNETTWDEEGKLLFEWTQNLSVDKMFCQDRK